MQDSPPHLTFIVFAYKGKYPEGSLRNTFFLWIWTGGPAESQISLFFLFVRAGEGSRQIPKKSCQTKLVHSNHPFLTCPTEFCENVEMFRMCNLRGKSWWRAQEKQQQPLIRSEEPPTNKLWPTAYTTTRKCCNLFVNTLSLPKQR